MPKQTKKDNLLISIALYFLICQVMALQFNVHAL